MEIAGCLFTAVGCIFMRNLYTLSNYGLSGVLFGSVNSSPWEYAKTLFLPYLAWSMLELLCLGKGLHRLAVVKASSMCLLLGLYLSLSTVLNGKHCFYYWRFISALRLFRQKISSLPTKYQVSTEYRP